MLSHNVGENALFENVRQFAMATGAQIVAQTRREGAHSNIGMAYYVLVWRLPGGLQVVGTLVYGRVNGLDNRDGVVAIHFAADGVLQCPPIELRPETLATRLARELRLVCETTTGDAAFDSEVCIDTEFDEAAQAVLKSDTVRQRVRAIVPYVVSVLIGHRRLSMRVGGAVFWNAPLASALLERFAALAAALTFDGGSPYRSAPAAAAFSSIPTPVPHARRVAFIILTGAILALCAFTAYCLFVAPPPTLPGPAPLIGVGAGLAFWLIATVAAIVLLRGRTKSARGILVAALVFGIPVPLGYNAALAANAQFDAGKAVVREGEVRRVWPAKGPPFLELTAEWRDTNTTIDVPEDRVRGKASGRARVVTRPGALGSEWIESVDIQ